MTPFELIKQKISILDVVGGYTTLKKAGSYYKGACPFHHEKTASFTVSPHKEIFYCFGCHVGGDVISFIAKIEGMAQMEAVRHLAERYNIELPQDILQSKNDHKDKDWYFKIFSTVAHWTRAHLKNNPVAQEYLRNRGLTDHTIDNFSLGYFPSGPQAIKHLTAFVRKENIMIEDLLGAHIIKESGNGIYSPFEDRIMFSIKDHLGRIVGFGARVFKPQDDRPKYYNSQEHAYFNKGSLIYGLDQAKKDIQSSQRSFLVEGYLDTIMMAQYGYRNTVATLGTACTLEHLKQLARYTQRIYVMYDGDSAGQKAIFRLLELCWQVNLDLYVISLLESDDPASFLASGKSLEPLITNAPDIFEFYINSIGSNFSSKSLSERIEHTKKLLELIGHLPDQLKRDILISKASSAFNIPAQTLKQELYKKQNRYIAVPSAPITPEHTQPTALDKITLLEKKLISAILSYTGAIDVVECQILVERLTHPLNTLMEKILALKAEHPGTEAKFILDMCNEQEKNLISKCVMEAQDDDGTSQDLHYLLTQFFKIQWKLIVRDFMKKLSAGNNAAHTETLSQFEVLKKKMLQRGIK